MFDHISLELSRIYSAWESGADLDGLASRLDAIGIRGAWKPDGFVGYDYANQTWIEW